MKIHNIAFITISLMICVFYSPAGKIFAEEDMEGIPSDIIKQLLADEDIPQDIKQELEEMYKNGELEEELEKVGIPEESPQDSFQPPMTRPERRDRTASTQPGSRANPPQTKWQAGQPQKEDTSNKISLDLKGVDIIDVLKMLSTRSNMNIVAGKNVRGRVTLFLKDVDVWDAFEMILASNDLAYEKSGDIINVMTERDYERLYGEEYHSKKELRIYRLEYAKALEVSKALNQAKSKIGKVIVDENSNSIVVVDSLATIADMERMIAKMDIPVETRIFSLDYAKAEDVKTKLSEMLTKGVGFIQVDERTNKMVITELAEKMPDIAGIIDEMDERHREVLIEAKIVQISLNDQYRYGVDWKALFHKIPDEGLRFNFNELGDVFGGSVTGGALTVGQFAHDYLDMAIEILQTAGKTNVISCPRITVLNNEEAKVLVGTQQPYVEQETISTEASDRTNEIIKEKDVGVSLAVTPTINKEGFVTMKIKPKISSVTDTLGTAGERTSIPVVSTSETETTVMVKDGTTIIIAGLIEDRDEKDSDKIPVLGDIPIVGNLFKNTSKGNTSIPEKKELVVFLTPYIMHGTEIFPEVENVRYKNSLDQKDQKELLDGRLSLAVKEMERPHVTVDAMSEVAEPEEVDMTTRLSEDLIWIEKKREATGQTKKVEEAPTKEVVSVEEILEEEAIPVASRTAPPLSSSYYNYYINLRNKIFWVAKDLHPKSTRGKREDVVVLFTLLSDGSLKNEPRVLNEVDNELALAAKNAVELAAPFPSFPARMVKEEEMFKITITYR
ncbi:MAG: hypothetical protein JW800_05305 [Candidatus Omnitrophica bacterium]|nr:hypothetical protein [Candidatus Omnitrophota bacterium]